MPTDSPPQTFHDAGSESAVPLSRKGLLARQAADQIREAIVRGTYAPGRPLREVELSEELGISRSPVREALRQLLGEGLVEVRPNKGTVVTSMSDAELNQISEVCRMIEAHLMQQAVPGLGAESLDQAAAAVERLDEIQDPVEWFRMNWAFHSSLYLPADRPLQVQLVAGLRARADRYIYLLARDPELRAALNREHRAILAACRAGEAERAAVLIDHHLDQGRRAVGRMLEGGS
jgi:DNA-binding GntR family transcriptional regulator